MQVEFNDPTENLPKPEFKGYIVVVCKTISKFKYYHLDTKEEVHDIISSVDDYFYHKQNLTVDPYKYIVITRRYYNEVGMMSLFHDIVDRLNI